MADFKFIYNRGAKKYVILDPNRARRPNIGHKIERTCPFCIGLEKTEKELYRVGGSAYDTNWQIRVIENKYPFTPHHEIIIHSPDHHKNFEELPVSQIEIILKTYRERFVAHQNEGIPYIFHNRGIAAGESIPHPHSQVTVLPRNINPDIPPLNMDIYKNLNNINRKNKHKGLLKSLFKDQNSNEFTSDFIASESFFIYCPENSQWPDEVWIAPFEKDRTFGQTKDNEITDLAFCLQRIISIFDLKLGHEFPLNLYIYPGKNWYLRIIPRTKILGGFELGTGIIVNTQDPKKTINFLKENFFEPNLYKIRLTEGEDFWRSV